MIQFEIQDKYFKNFCDFISWVNTITPRENVHIVSASYSYPEIWIKYRDESSKSMDRLPAFGQTGSVSYSIKK